MDLVDRDMAASSDHVRANSLELAKRIRAVAEHGIVSACETFPSHFPVFGLS